MTLSKPQERALARAVERGGLWIPQARSGNTIHALYRRGLVRSAYVKETPMPVLTDAGLVARAGVVGNG